MSSSTKYLLWIKFFSFISHFYSFRFHIHSFLNGNCKFCSSQLPTICCANAVNVQFIIWCDWFWQRRTQINPLIKLPAPHWQLLIGNRLQAYFTCLCVCIYGCVSVCKDNLPEKLPEAPTGRLAACAQCVYLAKSSFIWWAEIFEVLVRVANFLLTLSLSSCTAARRSDWCARQSVFNGDKFSISQRINRPREGEPLDRPTSPPFQCLCNLYVCNFACIYVKLTYEHSGSS